QEEQRTPSFTSWRRRPPCLVLVYVPHRQPSCLVLSATDSCSIITDVVAAVSSLPPIFLSLVRRLLPSFRSDAAAEHATAAIIYFRRRRSISSPGRRSSPEFLPFAPENRKAATRIKLKAFGQG
ncbi:hypothetical protein LINPERHAP2_LOCUS28682, partial [Linum perenne]